MVNQALYNQIAERLLKTDKPDPMLTASNIFQTVLDFIKNNLGLCSNPEEIRKVVSQLYDDYIAPIDLPGVPNFIIEPKVDALLKEVLVNITMTGVERICSADESIIK